MTAEDRLARLERESRYWRRLACVLIGVIGVVVLMGQGKAADPEHVKVRSLRVVDGEGRQRILLGVNDDGPELWMGEFSDTGIIPVKIRAGSRPGVYLLDNRRRGRSSLILAEDGTPVLVMRDGDTKAKLQLMVNEGKPSCDCRDRTGLSRATLALVDDLPSLVLADAKGNVIWQAPTGK
jgi:hypothetical protein